MFTKQSAVDEYEAKRRLQDIRDVFALAEVHMGLSRCVGGRLQNAGYMCHFCKSYAPDKLCKQPMRTQTGGESCESPCSSQDCTC